jgi:diketogulonate reductase-like aldo/keto reductase
MDHVDLWLVHWPPRGRALVSTWKELLAARDQGLARPVGVSNYRTAQLDELIAATGAAPQVNQIPWAPALYDAALLGGHRRRRVVLEGYSPLRVSVMFLRRGDLVQLPAEADECASCPEDGPGFGASAAPGAQRPGVGQVADRLQRAGVGPQRPWGP